MYGHSVVTIGTYILAIPIQYTGIDTVNIPIIPIQVHCIVHSRHTHHTHTGTDTDSHCQVECLHLVMPGGRVTVTGYFNSTIGMHLAPIVMVLNQNSMLVVGMQPCFNINIRKMQKITWSPDPLAH